MQLLVLLLTVALSIKHCSREDGTFMSKEDFDLKINPLITDLVGEAEKMTLGQYVKWRQEVLTAAQEFGAAAVTFINVVIATVEEKQMDGQFNDLANAE